MKIISDSLNANKYIIDGCEPLSFDLYNSTVLINKSTDYDYKIQTNNLNITNITELIKKIYFLSPDKLYKIIFNENEYAEPNTQSWGVINLMTNTIEHPDFYKNKKIFSYCVYKANPKYTIGAIKNCEQYVEQYKNFMILFFVRNDVPEEIIKKIKEIGGTVIKTLFVPDWFMMFARFLPSESSQFLSSRDTDCRLILREKVVNEQFMCSNKNFHIIRDHPYHTTEILGGMWSVQNLNFDKIRFAMLDFCLKNDTNPNVSMGHDQNFLTNYIWPHLNKELIMAHDNFFNYNHNKIYITLPRNNREFIGEPYDENDDIEKKFRDVIVD
jgi:hypothetical protein